MTLNANTGKIVLMTLCIQIEWLFYNVFGVKLSYESGADSIGSTCPHFYAKIARWRHCNADSLKTLKANYMLIRLLCVHRMTKYVGTFWFEIPSDY